MYRAARLTPRAPRLAPKDPRPRLASQIRLKYEARAFLNADAKPPEGALHAAARTMGDTTSIFVLELYEMWRNTGDDALVRALWPSVQKAVGWMLTNANDKGPFGLPQYLETTYDHFGFGKRRLTPSAAAACDLRNCCLARLRTESSASSSPSMEPLRLRFPMRFATRSSALSTTVPIWKYLGSDLPSSAER